MAGFEVEELDRVAPPFNNVVVAQVLEVTRHPDADRLNVCRVDTGCGASTTIVCGAPNVAVGLRVPCALQMCIRDRRRPSGARASPDTGPVSARTAWAEASSSRWPAIPSLSLIHISSGYRRK